MPIEPIRRLLPSKTKRLRALVDERYYRASYSDVATARVDPFHHFMEHGWREGRNPSARFHTLFYRDAYLAEIDVNPLVHYVESGRAAGLDPLPGSSRAFLEVQAPLVAPFFDATFYRAQGGILNEDPLMHYLVTGWREGRAPHAQFDVAAYNARHVFLKSLDVSPLYHFASQERLGGRIARAASRKPAIDVVAPREVREVIAREFDKAYYESHYRDVARAGLEALTHYLDHGWRERRNPTALFDSAYYLSKNPEVAESGANPFFHYLTKGRAEGRRGNPVGTRLYPTLVAPPDSAWDAVQAACDTVRATYVVVMPVYKGYAETLASIYAVLASSQKTRFALHVVNDKSPDAELTAMLANLAARGLFSYAENELNVGFVKSVNRALRQFARKEIILLNSDAVVHGDWLDRIDRHVASDPTIATLTPFSNNATICSYPVTNENNVVEMECSAAELDDLASRCNAGRLSDIPTGVGFCFYMSRASRGALGILDEVAFGRGYGEENDFCLRATKAGFRNVLAEDIIVYHAGEVSFKDFVAAEYGPGQAALLAKHPDYPQRVQNYLRAEAAEFGRMRLDLYRLALGLGSGAIVFVSHALTGGIETHIARMKAALHRAGVAVVHLKVGVGDRWGVQIGSDVEMAPFCPNLRPIGFNQIKPLLATFLGWLRPRAIHVHSVVGFDWSATTGLLDLLRDTSIPYYFTLHDYSVVCHRNDLVKPDATYCGLPDVTVCTRCVASDRAYPEAVDPLVRRQTFQTFLDGAAAVFAPAEDIAARLRGAGAAYRITIRPHEEPLDPVVSVPRPDPDTVPLDLAIIGAIGPHKGAQVLLALARDAKARALPVRFHIIGYSSLTEELRAAGVTESGRYATDEEAFALVRELRPAGIFLPSIWPETFCYALSLAFDLEVPPVVFDLGAQRERVETAGFGFVLPYGLIDDPSGLNDRLLKLPYAAQTKPKRSVVQYADILRDYYGFAPSGV